VSICAYCGLRRAVNLDHVVPKSTPLWKYRRDLVEIPPAIAHGELTATVPACFDCNIRKGARRLVPPSWADKIDALNDYFGGTPWRVWDGNPQAAAFREVHV